jgi:NTE family protein
VTAVPPTGEVPFADWPRPLAFVLSGGGSYGSVQVGMIRALLERGVMPDLIVGASVGSLNGAMLAARPDRAVEELTNLWMAIDRRTIFGGNPVGVVRNLVRGGALCRPDRLAILVEASLGGLCFDDLTTPFAAVVTDALSGEPELLRHGPLTPALLASTAIPGVFPRVLVEGRPFVDGGVAANVPLRQAITFGAASILSLDATPAVPPAAIPGRLVDGLLYSITLMIRNQRSHDVDDLARRFPIGVLPSVTPPDIGSFNFEHTANLMERSYHSTLDTLDAWSASPDNDADNRPD